jgi:hypothetical protein
MPDHIQVAVIPARWEGVSGRTEIWDQPQVKIMQDSSTKRSGNGSVVKRPPSKSKALTSNLSTTLDVAWVTQLQGHHSLGNGLQGCWEEEAQKVPSRVSGTQQLLSHNPSTPPSQDPRGPTRSVLQWWAIQYCSCNQDKNIIH